MTDRLIDRITGLLKKRQWYEQPRLLAMFRLGEIRTDLREKNLHDTEDPLLKRADPNVQLDPAVRNSRSVSGGFNSPSAAPRSASSTSESSTATFSRRTSASKRRSRLIRRSAIGLYSVRNLARSASDNSWPSLFRR